MSSKLVKKGLDFVCSTKESTQERGKDSQKKKQKSRKRRLGSSHKGFSTNKKGKLKEKDDFTQPNLKYFKHSAWSIKKDTYEKIVQHHAEEKKSKKEENPTTEEEEEDLF